MREQLLGGGGGVGLLGLENPVLFGGIVVSGQGSLPLAIAKFMMEVLILSRLVFVVDNFVPKIEDRKNVIPAVIIKPIITMTTAISISEKPCWAVSLNWRLCKYARRWIRSLFFVPTINEPLRQ